MLIDHLGLHTVLFGFVPALQIFIIIVYLPMSLLVAVLTRWILIGRYKPGRHQICHGFYLRNRIVASTVKLIPWSLLELTCLQPISLRALGATTGRRVHFDKGVKFDNGGWDLLQIGDDTALVFLTHWHTTMTDFAAHK
jgi:hypothetical protein